MRRPIKLSNPFALLLTIALLQVAPGAWADAPVWRVTDGESTVYLGGTVHLLRPEDYPLPEEFDQAYEGSSELFFETDISSMNDLMCRRKCCNSSPTATVEHSRMFWIRKPMLHWKPIRPESACHL